ncbi:hypothetical protein EGW08_017518, partial [Elysia chlorotica]
LSSLTHAHIVREPKTSAEVQYCHAFVTHSPEQAEELIALIGEAFKNTYTDQQQQQQPQQQQQHHNDKDAKETAAAAQPKKQPTFHELIEQQVLQQQAKFREIELEAQSALQQTLNQIATPTPFSERAQSRMEERRRQSEDFTAANSSAAAARRDWAKHEIHRVKHSPDRSNSNNNNSSNSSSNNNSPASNPNRRSEIPTRQSTPKTSPFKRNSVPPQVTLSSSQPHPLSALAIKESLESKAASKGSKFKGSPVTALKNEIDRRLSMTNGDDPPPPLHPAFAPVEQQSKQQLQQQQQQQQQQQHQLSSMANRPLPLPPDEFRSPHHRSRNQSPQHQQSQQVNGSPTSRDPGNNRRPVHSKHQRSLDDYHLPRSSTSPQVMVSSARPPAGAGSGSGIPGNPGNGLNPGGGGGGGGGVRLRDSPRKRQPRPMSEIATSCSGHGGARPGGSSYYEQQRQSLLSNFAASFSLQPSAESSSLQSLHQPNGESVVGHLAGNLRADGMVNIYGPGPAPFPREAEVEAYSLATAAFEPMAVGGPGGVRGGGGGGGGSKRASWASEEVVLHSSPSRLQFYPQQQSSSSSSSPSHHNHHNHHHNQNGRTPASTAALVHGNLREPSPSSSTSSSSSSPALANHRGSGVTTARLHGSPQHPPGQGAGQGTGQGAGQGSPSSAASHDASQVLRYQNDSQFVSASAVAKETGGPGLASLMCLDRSHILDETLRHAVWYQANLPREIALEILQQEEVGAFVVRDSSTHPGCYALSVRVPRFENSSGISHYLIMRTQRGVKLKGLEKEWSTLAALVTHHTVMREMLPCTLRLPKVKASSVATGHSSSPSGSPSHAPSSVAAPPPSGRQDTRFTRTKTVTRTVVNGNSCESSAVIGQS